MNILFETSLSYLPKDNKASYHFVDDEVLENVTAGFVIAFYNGNIVLANNIKRGMEIPGGHIEKGEKPIQAAEREFLEETGCKLKSIKPFIRLDMECFGEKPENYKYPFPKSTMEFFIGEVSEVGYDIFVDEVKDPFFINMDIDCEHTQMLIDKMKDNESFSVLINAALNYKKMEDV